MVNVVADRAMSARPYHPITIFGRRLALQSRQATCSARTMQVLLGGRPQRFDRSQSPQVKSDTGRHATSFASLAKKLWVELVTLISTSSGRPITWRGEDLSPLIKIDAAREACRRLLFDYHSRRDIHGSAFNARSVPALGQYCSHMGAVLS